MLVVYLPAANRIFHTRPMPLMEWGWIVLPAVLAVTLEAIRKRMAPHLFSAGQWTPLRMHGSEGKAAPNGV
jgi:hypothetical protein